MNSQSNISLARNEEEEEVGQFTANGKKTREFATNFSIIFK